MSTLDLTIPPLALDLINRYGKTIIHTSITSGAYDVATSTKIKTSSAQTIKGVVEEYPDNIRFSLGDSTGQDAILKGDRKVTIAAQNLDNVPVPGDKITIADVIFSVKSVATTYSGELVAIYTLQVRKA